VRDDRNQWEAARFGSLAATSALSLQRAGVAVKGIALDSQHIVSGTKVQQAYPSLAWPQVVEGIQYAVSLRRDRVLLVNSGSLPEGWDAKNLTATTNVQEAYAVLDVVGENAQRLLQRGAELSHETESRSAVRLLFGYEVILYRIADTSYRLHIDRAQADALWAHLTESANVCED